MTDPFPIRRLHTITDADLAALADICSIASLQDTTERSQIVVQSRASKMRLIGRI